MQFSKTNILIIGFILWPIIIAIPQFNLHYAPDLLSGKLNYGEIPVQFYLGLIAGLFSALFFWGISFLISKLISKIRKKEIITSITFLYITLFFFAVMLISQSKSFYLALTFKESKVKEARELIEQYESREKNKKE